MSSPVSLPKSLLIYAITIPVALVLGYFLTTPGDPVSSFLFLVVACVLSTPFLLRSHYIFLVFSWNASICVFFLPGQPLLWMLVVLISLAFTVVNHILYREAMFISVPSVTRTLLFLALVVFLTAKLYGGIGLKSMGSTSYGGKKYFYVFSAIAGYFALTSAVIPLHRARSAVALFFLSGSTAVISHVVALGGPAFYFLFRFFPASLALSQVTAEMTGLSLARLLGVSMACTAIFCYMLAHYGIRNIFTSQHPFRAAVFLSIGIASTFGGFRSALVWLILLFMVQFILEGLVRTRLCVFFVGMAILGGVLLLPFSRHLPLQVQRSVSFLPVEVDPSIQYDTQASTEFRLEMWKVLLPELPNYLVFGKGYTLDPTDLYLTQESERRGFASSYEGSLEAGDYHSGPLSIYVPLGGLGSLAFVLFLITGGRVLLRNYRHGPPGLKNVNTLLFALFLTRVLSFLFIFGAFATELYLFTGLIGLSVALNGGSHGPGEEAPMSAQLSPVV